MFMVKNAFNRYGVLLLTVIIAVCLVAPVAGCKKKDPEPGPNEVWIIGWTYEPDSLTVPVGTTVTWKNTTRDYHTVTSDTGLFDSRMSLGDSFNFTFNTPGTYGYHDGATDPQTTGKVIVQ